MAISSTLFKRLRVADWRQFGVIDIEFHRNLTVLTGVNGAGKSTLLQILSSHLGASRQLLGVPLKRDGQITYFSGLFHFSARVFDWLKTTNQSRDIFGQLEYQNGTTASLELEKSVGISYNPMVQNQQSVLGFLMPSHRLMPNYKQVPNIPFGGMKPEDSFNTLINEAYAGLHGNHTGNSILFQLKQILACWATVGEGNSTIDADPAQYEAYKGFIEILRKIIPAEVGFQDLKMRPPDVLLETAAGTFLIDAASGGLVTLIEISAMIYTCSLRADVRGGPFVVTFDEPENHLHPSLQRSLLPTLVDAFPQVQFVVATHSPFMVSSRRDSNVYVLRHRDTDRGEAVATPFLPANRFVDSTRLDQINRAGTAGEILREVLGVPITLPAWVEAELRVIVDRYADKPITEHTLETFRTEVSAAGLSELFSDALAMLGGA